MNRILCTVHSVMTAFLDPEFAAVLNSADLATPDGMPLAWAMRSFGVHGQPRVYGPDLMLRLLAQADLLGHRIYLYGGHPETIEELCRHLNTWFPHLKIAGSYCPPFRPLSALEAGQCVRSILDADPDILFVGIGAPKQERWMAAHAHYFPGVVMLGVGAAFDFHAGRVRQAPAWMQHAGLEWFFRLLMEPARLWKRYVLLNPLFLAVWTLQKLRLLHFPATTFGVNRR